MAGVEKFEDARAVAAHAWPLQPVGLSGYEDATGWLVEIAREGDPSVAADGNLISVSRPDGATSIVSYLASLERLRAMTPVSLSA